MWNFDYKAHTQFVAPAKDKSELWRLVLGLFLAAGLALVFSAVYGIVIGLTLGAYGVNELQVEHMTGSTPISLLVLLSGFLVMTLAVFAVLKTLHRRPARSLFGPFHLAKSHFVAVTIAMCILLAVTLVLPPWGYGEPLVPNLAFGKWIMFLPLALVAVLIQTSAEEILFRGYIQQQLAARFKSPIVWMLLPSILFGLLHYDPEAAGENTMIVVVWAMAFGMMMADLTARSGSLGPAMAVHFVNNASAMLLISMSGNLDGISLYVLPFGMDDTEIMRSWLFVDFGFICVCWLTARLAIKA